MNSAEPVYCVPAIASFIANAPIIMLFEDPTQRAANRRVVIYHKNTNCALLTGSLLIDTRQIHHNTIEFTIFAYSAWGNTSNASFPGQLFFADSLT